MKISELIALLEQRKEESNGYIKSAWGFFKLGEQVKFFLNRNCV